MINNDILLHSLEPGEIIQVRKIHNKTLNFYYVYGKFLYYDENQKLFFVEIENEIRGYDIDSFLNLINITTTNNNNNNNNNNEYKKQKRRKIPFVYWLWYIFLMSISILFYSKYSNWLIISIIFFYLTKRMD